MTNRFSFGLAGVLVLCFVSIPAMNTYSNDRNFDESLVPEYELPDPLRMEDGSPVSDAATWREKRRAEILELFEEHVYGRSPELPANLRFSVRSLDEEALDGKATRKEITVHFGSGADDPTMEILLYVPNGLNGPAPAFVGLNFYGNHTVDPDPDIFLPENWMRANKSMGVVDHRATEAGRGIRADRWPVEKIVSRGYALATIYCGDIVPDHADGLDEGIAGFLRGEGAAERQGNDWGAIGAWAWGLSRALDYFEADSSVDATRTAVMGHSRLGKTALWAGAQDERFALVISNNSGCGGAALSRRRYGETVKIINTAFPHWFNVNFREYNDREDELPVDQHQLVALMAPRPVYVASAERDRWADPRGEFLSAKNAESVYRLLGKDGLGVKEMPEVDQPVGDTIGYHVRTGGHDVTDFDWNQFLAFADRNM